MHVLLVEDDLKLAETIKEYLQFSYDVEIVTTGADCYTKVQHDSFDIIIIDYILPDSNGELLCRGLREKAVKAAILVLTGIDDVENKIVVLNAGADDYLTKPFNFEELSARIRALLRRPHNVLFSNQLLIEDLELDTVKRTVKRANNFIFLRRKEMLLLEYLMRNAGKAITRNMIFNHVWNDSSESGINTIDVHIKYLRDRIDRPFGKKLIKTIHGVGYKIEA